MIHICFCLHDKTGRYTKFTGTAMLSLFENVNTPPHLPSVTVHILHDNTLTLDNREKFSYLAGQYGQAVKFYNVEALHADKINEIIELVPAVKTSRFSVGTFYRLLIPKILSAEINKCIYLDSDIVVNLDINELWKIEFDDKPLAAVPESIADLISYETFSSKTKYLLTAGFVKYEDYFNSGMIIMNLKYLRDAEEFIMSGVKWCGEHPQCNCFDQDILNYLFSKNYLKLPVKFDQMTSDERRSGRNSKIRRVIYHYAGMGYGLDSGDPLNRLWLKYFVKTPFFDEETISRLFVGVQKMHIELKRSLVNLSAMMSGKTRAFFIEPVNVEAFKQIFFIRDDEEIILAENQASLQKLLDAMNASRGKKIFFFLVRFPFEQLVQLGFVFGRDFLDGLEFLSEVHGMPFHPYPLVKEM